MTNIDFIDLTGNNPLRINDRRSSETPESYARAVIDPMDVLTPKGRQLQRSQDKEAIDALMQAEHGHELIELMSDKLYLDFIDGNLQKGEIDFVGKLVTDINKPDLDRTMKWACEVRGLDLLTLASAFRYRCSEKEPADKVALEATHRAIIDAGVRLMSQMIVDFNGTRDGSPQRTQLVGKIFEVLCVTESRRRIYEKDEISDRILLSSTRYGDAPSIVFDPNHNFDAIEIAMDGTIERLLQFKAGPTDKEYEKPIVKITGNSYGLFLDNPQTYLSAISLLTQNSSDSHEIEMKKAKRTLETVIPTIKDNDLLVGSLATAAALASV